MGCDIHCYMEYKPATSDRWSSFGGRINPGRNYAAFGQLAGVRGGTAMVDPRGVPDGLGWQAADDNRIYISDTPSDGTVTPQKAAQWVASGSSHYIMSHDGRPVCVSHPDHHTHSWLAPDEWEAALARETEWPVGVEYRAMSAAMRELERSGAQVRVVFWFDN